MAVRHDDTNPAPFDREHVAPMKVTREIPLWGLLAIVGSLGAQAVALYYGQQRLVEKMGEVTQEVRALTVAGQQASADRVQVRFQIENLTQRVSELERRVGDLERRVK